MLAAINYSYLAVYTEIAFLKVDKLKLDGSYVIV